MTISLTYNSDLSRVQIALSNLTGINKVRVERSINQVLWETVRGGKELPLTSGSASLDDFEFAADVQNFYRVIPLDPEAGLLLPGGSTDRASTPDAASLDIAGDIDIRAEVTPDDWVPTADQTIVGKYDISSQRAYQFVLTGPEGGLRLQTSVDGVATLTKDSSVEVGATGRLAVRTTLDVNNGSSQNVARFYTAPAIDETLTELGTPDTDAGTTSIFNSTSALYVGGHATGSNFSGIVHAVEIRNGINGTVVANPRFDKQTHGATSFADDAGNTWTVSGNATIIGEVLESSSITPSLAGEVWLKSIRHPFLNRAIARVAHRDGAIGRPGRGGLFDVSGRSLPVAVTEIRGSQGFVFHILSESDHLEFARDLDLILTTGDVFFIHVPAGSRVPGGYVFVESSEQVPLDARTQTTQEFMLSCRVVAPPPPEVVGTTLTWGTVYNLYGSWTALLNANPTWADLLDTVGSPDDLVVL